LGIGELILEAGIHRRQFCGESVSGAISELQSVLAVLQFMCDW